MKFFEIPLKGAYLLEPEPFEDERGSFARLFCRKEMSFIPGIGEIVQVNQSITALKGTVRGMHYQLPPYAEVKVIKAIKGSIFDVIVDIRRGSPTFLKWYGRKLSLHESIMMCVPMGFAHGFQSLEDDSEIIYFVTQYYSRSEERGIRYNDPIIGIEWPVQVTMISEKDRGNPLLAGTFEGIDL
jgi:dTDP-4-dehydrorhamnose 3,5-epimerase